MKRQDRSTVRIGITKCDNISDFIQNSNEIQRIHLLTQLQIREQNQLDTNSVHFQRREMNL